MTLAAHDNATAPVADHAAARRAMIDSQLRVSGINQDWLLAALARVPREDHVPAAARGHAYIDRAIPLADGNALPAPLVQAMLLAEAAPGADEKVLVISQTGYLQALVEPLVQSVETLDAKAAICLQSMPVYQLVLVDGAIGQLPGNIVDAVVEGGRIVTGLVLRGVTRLAIGTKIGGEITLAPLAEVGIPALREFAAPKTWSF